MIRDPRDRIDRSSGALRLPCHGWLGEEDLSLLGILSLAQYNNAELTRDAADRKALGLHPVVEVAEEASRAGLKHEGGVGRER
eukprot:764811-Hanusia_phi.AAC.1